MVVQTGPGHPTPEQQHEPVARLEQETVFSEVYGVCGDQDECQTVRHLPGTAGRLMHHDRNAYALQEKEIIVHT